MANARHAIDGVLGANIDDRTTDAKFELGTTAIGRNNQLFIYGQASGSVATGTCTVSGTFQITDTAGQHTADVAFADNEFGWVRQTAVFSA